MDCAIAPLLWRLPYYGIQLPGAAKPLINYSESMFERPSFQESLTEAEKEMRA
jgi:RNA polymerase-associated protein